MVKEEFKHMGEHKLLIATICAIMIIPFLYSVFFLKSVWDPYGNSGSLPVAVVNEDQTVAYNGKKMKVGEDLVKKLKKNDDLDWHFVSAKQAKYGISHKKYYMVVTIPKNFSKNATTVLDKTPKKMQLKYKTNDSLNYIGKVISEEGVKQLNTEVRKSVSTAYAKTMFATIKKVGKGFSTAAKGADKLKTGSNTLTDGINTYTAGVKKVNDGVIELQTGVVPLSSGVLKLTTGATALSSGVQEYTAGVDKVNTGTQKLNSSTGTLATGVGKLASGSNSLASGVGTYTNGVNSLSSGLNQLSGKSSELNSGIQQLASSTSQLPTAAAGFYVMNNVLAQDIAQINSALQSNKESISDMSGSMKSINATLNSENFKQQLESLESLASQTSNIESMITQADSTLKSVDKAKTTFSDSLTSSLKQIATNSSTVSGIAQKLEENADLSQNEQIKAALDQIIALSGSATDPTLNTSSTNNIAEISNIKNAAATLDTATDLRAFEQQLSSLSSVTSQLNSLSSSITQLQNMMNESKGLTNSTAQQKVEAILTLTDKMSDLNTLANTAASSAKTFNTTVNSNSPTISASNLTTQAAMQSEITAIAKNSTLNSRVSQLVSGVSAYTSGADKAATGANTLVANNSVLNSGASQLSSGLGTLNSNVPTLVSGVSQLASGTQTLSNNSSTLNSGASQLASGLTTLNNKVPTLTSGVNQLASGTSQLAANSDKLSTGSAKLTTGNKALAKALNKGAKQVNAVKTSNKTANMFAAPSNLKHSNYSKVPNYGYALAPYMLSVALFVGSLVFNLVYPIRRMSSDGTGTEWFLSKVSVGFLVATGNALIETIFMMVFGLVPMHLPSMIINALFFSYSAMFLIMFMSMLGNNPGRFLAMILLVIQLGACGGSFPIQITNGMNGFFQAINPFLPMTYSVLGFRQALNSGLGEHQVIVSVGVLSAFIIVCLFLLWLTMTTFVKKGIVTYEENKPDSNYPGN
ncbi:YhgE/Pip family protein [Liquorilactobacillus nagelii]|jgi:putative membrane protein|uniref:YhgE/Pip family protein n=1 Tax=Liquorilactobacillus nagelii TaxID=82688 RepID=UPI002430A3D5|nr:YhgE/Pip family protein [Liquorilactobacillus nagelii]MCI1699835.1 YhgE/Pip domain-containing protein [Liquorilactobacillus nagelii]